MWHRRTECENLTGYKNWLHFNGGFFFSFSCFSLNYNLLNINSTFLTVSHKRRKSSPLVKALKWQLTHTNDQRGKLRGVLNWLLFWCRIWLEEKIYSKGCNETAEEIKYIRWASWATWRAGWRQVRKKNTKGKRNTALKIRPKTQWKAECEGWWEKQGAAESYSDQVKAAEGK